MRFALKKATISKSKTLVTFEIIDDAQNVRGTISVPREAEQDLLKHWSGPIGNPPVAKPGMAKALLAQRPKVSKAAILRGCQRGACQSGFPLGRAAREGKYLA
jgi:hypothetical protein